MRKKLNHAYVTETYHFPSNRQENSMFIFQFCLTFMAIGVYTRGVLAYNKIFSFIHINTKATFYTAKHNIHVYFIVECNTLSSSK